MIDLMKKFKLLIKLLIKLKVKDAMEENILMYLKEIFSPNLLNQYLQIRGFRSFLHWSVNLPLNFPALKWLKLPNKPCHRIR